MAVATPGRQTSCKFCKNAAKTKTEDERGRLEGNAADLKEGDPSACVICLGVVNEDAPSETRALWAGDQCKEGHAFHFQHLKECVEAAIRQSARDWDAPDPSCPVCREPIEALVNSSTGEEVTLDSIYEALEDELEGEEYDDEADDDMMYFDLAELPLEVQVSLYRMIQQDPEGLARLGITQEMGDMLLDELALYMSEALAGMELVDGDEYE